MSTLTIALVSFKFPPRFSGYGNQLYAVSRRIVEREGDSVRFVAVSSASGAMEAPKGISRVVNLLPRWIERLSPRVEFYLFVLCLSGWLIWCRQRYSIIHCVKAGPESAVCLLVGTLLRKPVIVKVAQDEIRSVEDRAASRWKKFFRRKRVKLLEHAAAVVAISREIRDELLRSGVPRNLVVCIPNGVDETRFRPVAQLGERETLRRRLEIPGEAVVGLFVGALSRRKGIDTLLAALRGLTTTKPFQFIFCGPNYELSAAVRQECERARGRLRYVGNIRKVEEYMRAADFIVLPSISEGLPNVLLEASLCGLAIVGTEIGGIRDIVAGIENGILVPVGDATALSDAIDLLIEDDAYRTSLRSVAASRALQLYSLDYVADRYHGLYGKVVS